jgi:hypothetical protein
VSRHQEAECAHRLTKPIQVCDDSNTVPAQEVLDPDVEIMRHARFDVREILRDLIVKPDSLMLFER